MKDHVDLRLLPAAGAAWCAAITVVLVGPEQLAVFEAISVCGVVLVLVWRRRCWSGQVILALGVGAAVLLAGGAQQNQRWSGPIPGLAASRGAAEISGSIQGSPVRFVEDRCSWQVNVHEILVGRVRVSAATSVEIVGPCQDLVVGSTIKASGTIVPLPRGRAVARLNFEKASMIGVPSLGFSIADELRRSGRMATDRLPSPARELVPAIVWGDTSKITQAERDLMVRAGLAHLTAVSGAHFALVLSGALLLGQFFGMPSAARAFLAGIAGVGLLLVVGPEPSVLRAAVMGGIDLLGLGFGRRSAAPAALSAGVVLLLLLDPWLALELGFALSVVATAGIIGFGGCLTRRWSQRIPHLIAIGIAVPFSAQLVVTPILIVIQPDLPTLAVAVNVLAGPAVGVVTISGLTGLALSGAWPQAASWFIWLAAAGVSWIVSVAMVTNSIPGSVVPWAAGFVGVLAATATAVGLMVLLCRGDLAGWAVWLQGAPDQKELTGEMRRQRWSSW